MYVKTHALEGAGGGGGRREAGGGGPYRNIQIGACTDSMDLLRAPQLRVGSTSARILWC